MLWGSVSSGGDLGAGLRVCGLGTKPHACDLGTGPHNSLMLGIHDCTFNLTESYLYIWLLRVLVAAGEIFRVLDAAGEIFSCGMWDLVPSPGIEPGPPALGVPSLGH